MKRKDNKSLCTNILNVSNRGTLLENIFFNRALLKLVPPLRGHADALTEAMVEFYSRSQKRFTPDMQAHYIYSPRELSRWIRALHEALKPLETCDLETLIQLWLREALRLFQDRLVEEEEKEWTDITLDEVALKHFPGIDTDCLKRPILFPNWLTKEYTLVDRDSLRDFVKARLKVFTKKSWMFPWFFSTKFWITFCASIAFSANLKVTLFLLELVVEEKQCFLVLLPG
jgi:hypothetical protein